LLAAAVCGLLLLHVLLAMSSVWESSATCDEVAHLTAGYSYFHTGDWRLVPEHPPLAELWAALPLLVSKPTFPTLEQPAWWTSNQWEMGGQFLYETGNDAATVLTQGRSMIVVLSVVLGLVVFLWSRRLFGTSGGLLSLVLYACSPTMLAHAPLVTTDLTAALFFLLATAAWWALLHEVTLGRVLACGAAAGCLALAKMSAVLMVPIALVLLIVRLLRPTPLPVRFWKQWQLHGRWGQLGVLFGASLAQLAVVWFLIWAVFGFRYDAMVGAVPGRDDFRSIAGPAPYEPSWEAELRDLGFQGDVVRWLRDHRVLPESYLYGLANTFTSTYTRAAFLNGQRSRHGFVAYFPYSFLVKTTLPVLALLLPAVWVTWRRSRTPDGPPLRGGEGKLRADVAPLWALIGVYAAGALASHLNIGHRHLLPIYPALFILAGVLARPALRSPVRLAVWSLAACHVVVSMAAWPNYLAYFNSLIGGPRQAYRHFVDSSLDWGQDLQRLASWLGRHAPQGLRTAGESCGEGIYLSYCGNASLRYHGICASVLPGFPFDEAAPPERLTAGIYCISATTLQQVYLLPTSRWTRALEETYQYYLPDIMQLDATPADAAPPAASDRHDLLDRPLLRKLRFARLCAALRQREPDDDVGHSILIYRVDERELEGALLGPAPEVCADDPENLCDFALQLGRAGGGALASTFMEQAAALAPNDVYVQSWAGVALRKQGRIAAAQQHFTTAARLDPSYPRVWTNLGLCLLEQGRPAEAVQAFRRELGYRPRHAETQLNLALALAELGRLSEAIEAACQAVRLRPRDPAFRLELADLLLHVGQHAEARALHEQLLGEQPADALLAWRIGEQLAGAGALTDAIGCYQRAVTLSPENATAHHSLGLAYSHLQQPSAALPYYEAAARLAPTMLAAHFNLGLTLAELGRPAEALTALERALELAEQQGAANVIPEIRARIEPLRESVQQQLPAPGVVP